MLTLDLYHFEIANIRFAVNIENHLAFQVCHPAYNSFLANHNRENPRPADITINIEPGRLSTGNLTKIFDSGQSWSMFRGEDKYVISRSSPAFKNPLWIAKIDQGFTRVTLHYSKKLIQNKTGQALISNPVCYPLDQILLMYVLARKEGALIHAAGFGIHDKGLVFPGVSGAGKSTLTRRFVPGKDLTLLSDDRIVIRKTDNTFHAFGTPWPGDAGIAVNRSVPLSGVFFIRHGSMNRIREITPKKALEKLLPVTSIPWYDREVMPNILSFCEDLAFSVPSYELHFRPDAGVVNVLEAFVKN